MFGWGCDHPEDLEGEVALEAADDFAAGIAFGDAAVEVAGAAPRTGQCGRTRIGLTVAAAVDPVMCCGLPEGAADG